jgi:hypothetical protein
MRTGLSRFCAILGVALMPALVLTLGIAVPSEAASPEITPTFPSCVPAGGNAVVEATLRPEDGWGSVRAYFRASGSPDYYFLEMRAMDHGKFFTVLPRALDATKAVDLRIDVRDGDEILTKTV